MYGSSGVTGYGSVEQCPYGSMVGNMGVQQERRMAVMVVKSVYGRPRIARHGSIEKWFYGSVDDSMGET